MTDLLTAADRSALMSRIRGKNTRPEYIVRSGLHRAGFRFRLHGKGIPGTPDLVLRKYNAIVFIHGCFWHGHARCSRFRLPKTRVAFWREKISANRRRDARNLKSLRDASWRVLVIWECGVRPLGRAQSTLERAISWLRSDRKLLVLTGPDIA